MNRRGNSTARAAVAPGEGERRAQRGLVPQYKVAAEKLYALLADGRLHAVGLADPEADTLDDIQLIRGHGGQLVLDAYQVKWSKLGETFGEGEFRDLLAELVSARRAVIAAAERRAQEGEPPVARVIAHLYTSRVASTSALRAEVMRGSGCSLHEFIDGVWRPAQRELVRMLADIDPVWHPYVEELAQACGMSADELLALAPDLRVEAGRELEEDTIDERENWRSRDRLEDLVAIRAKLQDLVTDRHETYVWVRTDELVAHLGPEWAARWHPRQDHLFPTRGHYEPLATTAARLEAALDRYDHGYVVLTGSPGSGKSTLLTNHLRTDDRVAARYYAYVPDNDSLTRGEASAFLHDLYLAISGRRGRRVPAPRGNSLDVLRDAFREELERLGEQARRNGRTEIVLVDGLDHVERDPRPHQSLLRELPAAEEIPDGVLFVIGTRGIGDLPAQVRRAVPDGRHVEVEPLQRAAVLRLCERVAMAELGERVFELSAGHPLLVQTYSSLASSVEPERRADVLRELPATGGEVWDFYESVWEGLREDAEMVVLLGVVSRLRATIRLSWLARTGTGRGEVERLTRLEYLFERSGRDRWSFFHSSFREFLRARTAEVAGEFNEDLHRSHHDALADRCARSQPDDPERFERLFHLLEAGRPDAVLTEATPTFFREQLDALRPREAVRGDLHLAASALADCHDALAIVRLALAGNELQVRSYQFPESASFTQLLVAIGQPELAIAHVSELDDMTAGNDRTAAAMELVLTLHAAGLEAEAGRLLERYEPLEWFGARPASGHGPLRGPREALAGWARASAVLRGARYVIDAAKLLRSPPGLNDHERYDEEDLVHLRSALLWEAAIVLYERGGNDEAALLRDELVELGEPGSAAVAVLDLYLARASAVDAADERRQLGALAHEALPYWAKLELVERLLTLDDEAAARQLFGALAEPNPPERDYARLDSEEPRWDTFYRYWRIAARLGPPPEPVSAVPNSDRDQQVVLAARHVVAVAAIEGRQQAGEQVTAFELVAALRRMHAFWATKAGRDEYRRPGPARALASGRAVEIARRLGRDAVQEVFAYFRARWDERPITLYTDGTKLIMRFAAAGVGELSIRKGLGDLEAFNGKGESSPDDWLPLGQAWARAGDTEGAARCARRAVRSTLTLSSEKELQLGTWTRLLVPLLDGPQGERVALEFAAALTALSRESSGGAPDHAARILLEVMLPAHPLRAWELAQGFLESGVLAPDDVVEAFLVASSGRPGVHWWVAASELLVAIGADAPAKALRAAANADPAGAQRWLPFLLERVAVEGRPTSRRSWRSAVRDAAAEAGAADAIVVADDEPEIGDESPAQSHAEESETPPEPSPSVEEFLRRLEERDPSDYLSAEPGRALVRRLTELDDAQIARLERCLTGTDQEPGLRAALSARAAAAGDANRAWEEGERAIALSDAGDWWRHWVGGPMLHLVPKLRELDADRTRAAAFTRFAEIATMVEYFLGQVGADLADYAEIFEFPPEDTAREVLGVAAALLRDIVTLSDAAAFDGGAAPPAADDELALAFERLTGWFLASSHIVAWDAAQRAVLTLLAEGAGLRVLEAALAGSEPEVLRACAVMETAADGGHDFVEFVPVLEQLIASDSLTERGAAGSCLRALGRALPATTRPAISLPPPLRLELPPGGRRRSLDIGVAESTGWWRHEIDRLAEEAQVDEDALFEYVLARAKSLTDERDAGDERMSRGNSMLGWGFIKPSALVVRRALGETTAVLVDAGRVRLPTALSVTRLVPLYDTELLRQRPVRRPSEVTIYIPYDKRKSLWNVPIEELAEGAEGRVARALGDWAVIGERTELALADRAGHRERRWSGVVLEPLDPDELARAIPDFDDDGGELLHKLTNGPAAVYRDERVAPPSLAAEAIVGGRRIPPVASPAGWLAFHPQLATELGLEPDPQNLFSWRLDGEPAVRSIWWRSGYDRWPPYSDADETSQGWLVAASPALLERWRARQRLRQAWAVLTNRRGEEESPPAGEVRKSGVWTL